MPDIALDLPRHEAPRASRAGLVLVGAMVALALFEAGSALIGPRRVATDADWAAAAAEVRAGFLPGDLIVFAPPWTDAVGRFHLGDLVTPEMAARADASRYARIWEVAIRGAHAVETTEAGTYPGATNRHGRVRVTLYTRGAAIKPLYDFTAHAVDARVTQTAPDAPGGPDERTCMPEHELKGASGLPSFRCASTHVERRVLEVDFQPHAGILAQADGTRATRIEFDAVPLGNSLVGYTGIHDWHSRKSGPQFGAGPVDFKVFVDGAQLLSTRLDNQHAGWRPFAIPTLRYAGTPHTVRFEVSAPPGARERRLGFHVESRSEAPPAGVAP